MSTKLNKYTLLQVAELGNTVIRRVSKSVKDVKDKEIQSLIDNLIATIKDADGVGIAAPQVFTPIRLLVIASYPTPRYPNAPKMKPTAVINPEIIGHSDKTIKDWEGCLSVPGIRGLVSRYKSIKVKYTTRDGKLTTREFRDFIARIFQHECDHLDGIVFIDRVDNTKEIITEKEYKKLLEKRKNRKRKIKKSPKR